MLLCDFIYAEHVLKNPANGGTIPASFPRVCFTDYIYHRDCGSFIVIRINQKIERARQIEWVKKGLMPSGASAVFGSLLPRCDTRLSA